MKQKWWMQKAGFKEMEFLLEICCYNFHSCQVAEGAGAQRVELCANPAAGGTTPSQGMIAMAKENLLIPVFPIIRPRGGDFLYTREEYQIMQRDVLLCRQLGCEGVVIGMLQADGSVDKKRCKALVDLAYPMEVTFHRAFDRARDPLSALEDIIEIGCTRILTSGQLPSAADAVQLLKELVKRAHHRIVIMPGSGVRSANIAAIAKETGATEFHSSASTKSRTAMQYINTSMNDHLEEEIMVDKSEVQKMAEELRVACDTMP